MTPHLAGARAAWTRWLPAAAIREAMPGAEIDQAVRAWSMRWFGSGMVGASGEWADDPPDVPAGDTGWTLAGQMRLGVSPGGEARIAELMFGKMANGSVLTPADQQRIEAAASRCFLDLRHELASAVEGDGDWVSSLPAQGGWAVGRQLVTGAGAVVGAIALHQDLLVGRRIGAGVSRPGRPLVARGEALREQMLGLGACVGTAALTLADLGELRRGDVVLLDRSIADPLDLVITGRRVPVPCHLADAGETFLLHLS